MSLSEISRRDANKILKNQERCELISPGGVALSVSCFITDTSFQLDPDTGRIISERQITATLHMNEIEKTFEELPRPVEVGHPWTLKILSRSRPTYNIVYSVIEAMPDRTHGVLTLILGALE